MLPATLDSFRNPRSRLRLSSCQIKIVLDAFLVQSPVARRGRFVTLSRSRLASEPVGFATHAFYLMSIISQITSTITHHNKRDRLIPITSSMFAGATPGYLLGDAEHKTPSVR